MFGSNDDKKAPAEAGEKKGLFGWLRKKPQTPTAEPPPSEPLEDSQPFADEPDEQAKEQLIEIKSEQPEPVAEPEIKSEIVPQPEPEPVAQLDESMDVPEAPTLAEIAVEPAPVPVAEEVPAKLGFFARLKQGLSKTSASIGEGMASLFLGKKAIDDDLLDELETRLLTADVGVEATTAIMQNLSRRVSRKELADSGALYKALQEELADLLKPVEQPLRIEPGKQPFVILVVGVNGVGKTTTIGKLAKKLQLEGKKVMLAAGDTFRAAAVEQLQVWGERNNIAVIAQHTGADSASVIFDAVQAAKARGVDVLIADTAGRLHTKDNLMEELKKVRRVMGKLDETAPHEVLLVLDAGTGQNAINQTKQFNQAVELTGLVLTKLDGTAKGGVIFALAKQFGTPIRYIGVGEGIDDLRAFEADAFVSALFAEKGTSAGNPPS
ncbi:signal recognition particle-docking protein FtsY [Pseudomonas stutzeri]|uniref:signal recognition particle-docking protein FtsY n=1 Tax=Stutzerimonas stutzeri TaxID=316 RepID=UPI00210DD92D|nr:signal recognition particle-docking protein FtsY [Stutzerimonas stutzeri]MCQ4287470.1 signal recognition particle-docking protein FtsY [Stutzerimonas stutzeri]